MQDQANGAQSSGQRSRPAARIAFKLGSRVVYDTRFDLRLYQLGIAPADLAETSGISRSHLARLRSDQMDPTASMIRAIVRAAKSSTRRKIRASDFWDLGDDPHEARNGPRPYAAQHDPNWDQIVLLAFSAGRRHAAMIDACASFLEVFWPSLGAATQRAILKELAEMQRRGELANRWRRMRQKVQQ